MRQKFSALSVTAFFIGAGSLAIAQSVDLSKHYSTNFISSERAPWKELAGFKFRGRFEAKAGQNNNVYSNDDDKTSDGYLQTRASLLVLKQADNFAFNFSAFALHQEYESRHDANYTSVGTRGYGRLNITEAAVWEMIAGYSQMKNPQGDSRLAWAYDGSPSDERYYVDNFLSYSIGKYAITASGTAERKNYEDISTPLSGSFERSDRDKWQYGFNLRNSVKIGKNSSLYFEGGILENQYDEMSDRNGILRGSEGKHAALGYYFKPAPSLKGEFAIGYREQDFPDEKFSKATATTVDGWLQWKANEKVKFLAWGNTNFSESTSFTRAGSFKKRIGSQLDYYVTPKTRAYLRGDYYLYDYIGAEPNDKYWRSELGFNYEVKHGIVAGLAYEHNEYEDGRARDDSQADQIWLNLKITQ